MSKTHDSDVNDDLDAQLDAFIATKKTKPVVTSASQPINLFGSGNVKKKTKMSLLQRLKAHLPASLQTMLYRNSSLTR